MEEQLKKLKNKVVFLAENKEISEITDIMDTPIFKGSGTATVIAVKTKKGFNYFLTTDWKKFIGKASNIAPGKEFTYAQIN